MTTEQKQKFLDCINKYKAQYSMSLGATGDCCYALFTVSGSLTPNNYTCKESALYVLWNVAGYSFYSREAMTILGTKDTIDRTLKFWKRKNLPNLDCEIVGISETLFVLVIYLDNPVFAKNYLYLDVLLTMARLFSRQKEKVTNIVNLIPNEGSYLNLQDGVKLVLKTPPETIVNLNIEFIEMPTNIGGGTGIASAFRNGVLQKALAEHGKQ